MNNIRHACALSLLLLLSGCAFQGSSEGNSELANNNKAELYKIINDEVTTKSDARRVLGDPSDIDFNEVTNQEKWTYLHIDKQNLKRNYMPIFNFFSRGTKNIKKKIVLIFNANGTLTKSLVTESQEEQKNGLLD